MGVKAFDFAGGGEPALIPYLPDLMRYIYEKGGHYALICNGTFLPAKLVDALMMGATYVRVSLEASNAAMYKAYKQTDCFDVVKENIGWLLDNREHRGSGPEISLKFSVGKSLRGFEHYKRAIDIGQEMGVDRINFKALRHEPEELPPDELALEDMILQSILGHDTVLRSKVHYWIRPAPDSEIPQCWLTPTHTVMDHLGNIYLCCYYYYREEAMKLGNIFDDGFGKIWYGCDHWKKIAAIERDKCKLVDCKFFGHHLAVEKFRERGQGYFL